MKVRIDPEVCAGFGICIGIAPDRFALTEDGYAVASAAPVAPGDEEEVRIAANQCPANAIIIEDDD